MNITLTLSDVDEPSSGTYCARCHQRPAVRTYELETSNGFRFWLPLCDECDQRFAKALIPGPL